MYSMVRKFLVSMLLITFSLSAYSSIPEEFYVKQRWQSLTTTFDIETKEMKLGTVHRKFFSLMPQYDFYNVHDVLQAKARMRFLSFGAVFDVVDFNDSPIGVVEEQFSWFPTFQLIGSRGEFLGEAVLNFWGTKYTFKRPFSETPIATLTRPFFRLKDNWTVKIHDTEYFNSTIDPRLFIVVMAFQTDRDYWKSLDNPSIGNAFYLNGADSESEQINENEINALLDHLQAYTETLTSYDPSDEDIEVVENLPEHYLIDDFRDSSEETLIKGYKKLASLLDEDALTPPQKLALASMLSCHVKEKFSKE